MSTTLPSSQQISHSANGEMCSPIQCLPMLFWIDYFITRMSLKWLGHHIELKIITTCLTLVNRIKVVKKLHFHFGILWHFDIDIYTWHFRLCHARILLTVSLSFSSGTSSERIFDMQRLKNGNQAANPHSLNKQIIP